jgi:hypothetical protein
MIALPSEPGVAGLAVLAGGLVLGAALGWRAWRRLRLLLLEQGRPGRLAAVLLALTFAVSASTAPYYAWRIVQDLRYTTRLSRDVAERIGAFESFLDARAFDVLRERIPADDSFYVRAKENLELAPATFAFRAWALASLLPRRAVADPWRANWLVTLGIDPRTLGVPLASVRVIPTAYGERLPPLYLARVQS